VGLTSLGWLVARVLSGRGDGDPAGMPSAYAVTSASLPASVPATESRVRVALPTATSTAAEPHRELGTLLIEVVWDSDRRPSTDIALTITESARANARHHVREVVTGANGP